MRIDEELRQSSGVSVTSMLGMRTNGANFPMPGNAHSFTGHRNKISIFEDPKIIARPGGMVRAAFVKGRDRKPGHQQKAGQRPK
jgi:hypothetical protein